jgi:hypothetical protein
MNIIIRLHFGAMAPKIKEQLRVMSLKADAKHITGWQATADAITRLSVLGFLPGPVVVRCRKRLVKMISEGVTRGKRKQGPMAAKTEQ